MGRPDSDGTMREELGGFRDDFSEADAYHFAELVLNVSPAGFMTWLRVNPIRYVLLWGIRETEHPDGAITMDVEAESAGRPGRRHVLYTLCLRPLDAGKTLLTGYFVSGPSNAWTCFMGLLADAQRLFGPNSDGVNYMPPPGDPDAGARQPKRRGGRPRKTALSEGEQKELEDYRRHIGRGTPHTKAALLVGRDPETIRRWLTIAGLSE